MIYNHHYTLFIIGQLQNNLTIEQMSISYDDEFSNEFSAYVLDDVMKVEPKTKTKPKLKAASKVGQEITKYVPDDHPEHEILVDLWGVC